MPSVLTPQQLVSLPPPPNELVKAGTTLKDNTSTSESFEGGAGAGIRHLAAYFDSDCPKTYKETRNALDEWQSS
ncbi:MAG: deoxyribodipyrimidine photolyase, partial [Clostridia bacterium]|nr:deoxyribodipyrimidine photolyase [Clostridia bacterium]